MITNSDNDEQNLLLKARIRELKKLEAIVSGYNDSIKTLKEAIKASEYSNIKIVDGDEIVVCSISQYETKRATLNEAKLKAALNVEDLTDFKDVKVIQSVKISIK
ncbi:MAG: hypothetical protein ACRCYA_02470 [Cetobacterium sp.]|uniref:hypothetical protein n=1 Tax=Cetobacterium sp. TaxID=2071632 RepID=UPI003F3E18C0